MKSGLSQEFNKPFLYEEKPTTILSPLHDHGLIQILLADESIVNVFVRERGKERLSESVLCVALFLILYLEFRCLFTQYKKENGYVVLRVKTVTNLQINECTYAKHCSTAVCKHI